MRGPSVQRRPEPEGPVGGYEAGAIRARVQHNPKPSSYQRRHVDSTVMRRKQHGKTPGDPPDAPQGEGESKGDPNGRRESAEGVIVAGNEPGGGSLV